MIDVERYRRYDVAAPACQSPAATTSARPGALALIWCFGTSRVTLPHRIIASALSVNACGTFMPVENLINHP